MESSKKVTTVFIVVALVAMAALAISVSQKSARLPDAELYASPVPGLAENLASMEKITDFPAAHIRSVRVKRTDGQELALIREQLAVREFVFESAAPDSISAFSAILFANAAFLDGLSSSNAFTVAGFTDGAVIGELTYTSFDGLVLKFAVFRTETATLLRMIATHSPKLAAAGRSNAESDLLPDDEVIQIARRLNGRVYSKLDEDSSPRN